MATWSLCNSGLENGDADVIHRRSGQGTGQREAGPGLVQRGKGCWQLCTQKGESGLEGGAAEGEALTSA